MEPVAINPKQSKLRVAPEWADVCFTCGTCASGCPVTGVDGMDPRKAVRMAALGLDQELIDSRFPWVCTLCGRCEYACPQGVEILKMMRKARGLRERDKVPGPIHKGVVMDLNRGNNLGIPKAGFSLSPGRPQQGAGRGGFPGLLCARGQEGRQCSRDHQLQGAFRRAG